MNLNRRQFLKQAIALGVTMPVASALYWQYTKTSQSEYWLSAAGLNDQSYGLGWVKGDHQSTIASGFRGHGLCQNPVNPEQVVLFSRKPGTTGLCVNVKSGEVIAVFEAQAFHHMQGHGCFSLDGQYLFVTESNYQTGEGKITIYNSNTFQFVKQFNSYGIGPHEMALMPDGDTLVVANGGLLTHPDTGRKVLNYGTMHSNLAYLNRHTGALVSQYNLKESKASIRHLDVASNGTVAIALQVQRAAMDDNHLVPLAALHVPGKPIEMLDVPEPLLQQLDDYMGSVKIAEQAKVVAFTSPKGDLALFWDMTDLSFKGVHSFHDVCGLTISADQQYFILSNSSGKIRQINCQSLQEDKSKRQTFSDVAWDNHMLTVTLPS